MRMRAKSNAPPLLRLVPNAGIMSNIFDGIQRPLKTIAEESGNCFIPRGVNVSALDVVKTWEFQPDMKARAQIATSLVSREVTCAVPVYAPCAQAHGSPVVTACCQRPLRALSACACCSCCSVRATLTCTRFARLTFMQRHTHKLPLLHYCY